MYINFDLKSKKTRKKRSPRLPLSAYSIKFFKILT